MGYLAFVFACLFILESAPTSHRATIAGLAVSTGLGIAKLVLTFCTIYFKVLVFISFCTVSHFYVIYREILHECYRKSTEANDSRHKSTGVLKNQISPNFKYIYP